MLGEGLQESLFCTAKQFFSTSTSGHERPSICKSICNKNTEDNFPKHCMLILVVFSYKVNLAGECFKIPTLLETLSSAIVRKPDSAGGNIVE